MVYSSVVLAWFGRSNNFKVIDDNSHTFLTLLGSWKRTRIKVEGTKEGLGTRLGLGLWIEASTYGSTIALLKTMLNLVLLTSWVSYLSNYVLTVSLTDSPTKVADTPSGWASGWLRSGLTLLGLMDTPSELTDTLVETRRSRVSYVTGFINQRTLRERSRTLCWQLGALGLWGFGSYILVDTPQKIADSPLGHVDRG